MTEFSLSPSEFWSLSPREWAAISAPAGASGSLAAPLRHADLQRLSALYPDDPS